ncbi:MAG: LapA family protein [Paracoccaceae bacterium]|nr:LapA family protein [Paracoccaceae bacterium]
MTRYIRVIFLTCLSIIILTLAVANRELVDIRILPSELEGFFGDGMIFSIPIFVLFLCGVIFGLFVGFVWEWIREMKHRSASSRKTKELAKVENELNQLKRDSGQNDDEVLLLLNNKANS